MTPRWTVLACALLAACAAAPERTPRDPGHGEPALRVMSYNVNFGLAGDPATLEAIAGGDADLVLLQETTPEWEAALRASLAGRYPHMAFRHSAGAGGMGVLSRAPLEERAWTPVPSGWFPGWRLVAETPLGRVQVLAVHLHPPVSESGSYVSGYFTTDDVRLAEIEALTRDLEPGLPTLVVGDLNEEDGAACDHLVALGLRSALADLRPDEPTWRWHTSVGQLSLRLDHVFHDRALDALDARVLRAGRSDHLPLVVTLVRAR